MKRSELEHLIRAAGTIADDGEIIVIGSQSILGQFPDAPQSLLVSAEADLFPQNHPDRADLIDKQGNVIGAVVRTREKTNPLYVSPGHLMDVEHATQFVLTCSAGYRLPEPTRWAHKVAGGETLPSQDNDQLTLF